MKLKNIKCALCSNHSKSIFCDLAEKQINKLDSEKSVQSYEKGQMIFYDGNPAFAVYCIFSGLVKLFKTNRNGDQYIIRLLKRGDMLGYRAVLEGEFYTASAEALEPTIVCTIPRERFFKILETDRIASLCLLKKMAEEIRISEEKMISHTQETVRQRTARMLLYLIDRLERKGKTSLSLKTPLLRVEMAQIVGTTPETFSRTLHDLDKLGIIKLTRTDIVIEKLNSLKNLIEDRENPT